MSQSDNSDPLTEENAHERFVLLFSRERRRIYAFAYSLVPVPSDAEDIFQQVSLVLWRRFEEFDASQDFYKWACGVVYFTVKNYRRSKRRNRLVFSDELVEQLAEERVEWSVNESERAQLLDECLSLLKAKDRKLFTQVYGEGVKPKVLAEQLDRTVQGIYNRLRFVRTRILECVDTKASLRASQGK